MASNTGHIPREFINDLLNRIDLVEIINQRVPLKKTGSNFTACCPFHQEKTPSFNVSSTKQFYHCFGCGVSGNAVNFLIEYEGLDFVDAIESLASHLNIEVPHKKNTYQSNQPNYQPFYDLFAKINQFYSQQLNQNKAAESARQYLKNRQLDSQICRRFEIGFAPDSWDNLLQLFGQTDQQKKALLDIGMLSQNDKGRQYDRFRYRIMFPIHDLRGRTIGFGGRVLDDTKPKYLNSPETVLFHKGEQLYGLYQARKYNRHLRQLIIVEGYMDVIALAQFEIHYAVATLGTATTDNHLQLLFRNAPEIIFCFDGDQAGRDAAIKAMNICLKHIHEGRSAKFLFLPDGEDPDTLVRKELKAGFEARIQDAPTLSAFLLNYLKKDIQLDSIDGRAKLATKAAPYLAKIRPGLYHQMLTKELADLIQVKDYHPIVAPPTAQRKREQQRRYQNQTLMTMSPVRYAIALLLHYPRFALEHYNQAPTDWQKADLKGINIVLEMIHLIRENKIETTAVILEYWRDTAIDKHLQELACLDLKLDTDKVATEFLENLVQINKQYQEQRAEELQQIQGTRKLSDEEHQELLKLLMNNH